MRIPKLRAGSFFPSLLERRRRIDQALFAVVMEAYLHGVSTREVDDLVRAPGADTGISKSEVSRICADLDAEVAAFRNRSLAGRALGLMAMVAVGTPAVAPLRESSPGGLYERLHPYQRIISAPPTEGQASGTMDPGIRSSRACPSGG